MIGRNMWERLLKTPAIAEFVQSFPQTEWEACIELTLLLGIQTAQRLFPTGCSLIALARHLRPQSAAERPATASGDFVHPTKRRGTSDLMEVRSTLANGRPSLPKSLQHVTSRIKAEVQKDIERYFTPPKGREQDYDRESKRPLAHYPPRPVPKLERKTEDISLLREPKTNSALLERLESTDSSVIRITDRFLSDPLMISLSNRPSPRAKEWRFPSQLDFE